jgi:hypothetical protein
MAEAKKAYRHAAPPPPAEEPQLLPVLPPVSASYDVYVGGIHLLTAEAFFQEQDGKYQAELKGKTYGFWQRLFPWNTVMDVKGSIHSDTFVPAEFFTRDEWNHKPKITKLHFDGTGEVVPDFDPPNHDENREIVTPEQRHGALDPISALLQMLAHVAVQKNCTVTVPVFDGKRRFDISGGHESSGIIDEGDYSTYKGNARVCAADFKMISGEWKDREHARFWQKTETEEGRDPFHIWLAKPAPDLPEIPVRLESGSVWGLIVIHLTTWHYTDPRVLDIPPAKAG